MGQITHTHERTAPLGVSYRAEGSTFAVVAEADRVQLELTQPGTLERRVIEASRDASDELVWRCEVEGDLRGWRYAYTLERAGRILGGVVDPRAELVRADHGFICGDDTPVSPRPAMRPEDAVIYELHVRDFTRDISSGVLGTLRGTYRGLVERGTKVSGSELASGIDHLLELNVNVVQLMPIHGFAMPYDPRYEWGYMPLYFNAPHDRYASSVALEAPVAEVKTMVSALHEAGLRVTLDVVYNHTAEFWPTRLRSLMAMAPNEYFRFREDGTPWDGSACGNEFRSDSPHGRRFIVDSVMHWVERYGVDGFRFDLMGLIDEDTMDEIVRSVRTVDESVLIYGEPWAAAETPIKVNGKGNQRGRGWGVFNDEFRDGLRGHVFDDDAVGFLWTGEHADAVKRGMRGSVESFAQSPVESVNYVEAHDNHTLADRIEQAFAHAGEADKIQMQCLAALVLATSRGLMFIHSGQEFAREKGGHDNTYNLGDDINNIDWQDKARRFRLFVFFSEAVAMRRAHPMFRENDPVRAAEGVRFLDEDPGAELPTGVVACEIRDLVGDDPWVRALVYLNGGASRAEARVPKGSWRCACRDGRFFVGDDPVFQRGTIALRPHSGAVLYEAKE